MGAARPIEIEGEGLELLPGRAVHWPAQSTLMVSDLHWGKAETFRASGITIPDGIREADLARLSELLTSTGAKRLLVLGDLIHGKLGLSESLVKRISEWRKTFSGIISVVRGNHDRSWKTISPEWGLDWTEPFAEGPFYFTHEPKPDERKFTWAGHLHPTFRLASCNDSLRLPCFQIGPRLGILPAFSEFTRGVALKRKPHHRIFLIAEGNVMGPL